jgi:Tfp pilus assembly protein PilO
MNKRLREYWSKAPKSQRLLITLSTLLVGIAFLFLGVVEPYLEYREELKRERDKQELLYRKYIDKVQALEKLRHELKKVNEEFSKVKDRFFTEKTEILAFSVFKDKLSALAKEHGIKEEGVRQLSSLRIGKATKLRLKGRYKSDDIKRLLSFMHNVERGDKIMGFEAVDILLDTYRGRNTYYLEAEIYGIWIH